jgi:hypothetical protein
MTRFFFVLLFFSLSETIKRKEKENNGIFIRHNFEKRDDME